MFLKKKEADGLKPNSVPQEKKKRFTINKGQSTKGKPSSHDTWLFCKKHGHWKNTMNWNKPLSKVESQNEIQKDQLQPPKPSTNQWCRKEKPN